MKNDIIAMLLTVETFRLPIWMFQNKIQMAVVVITTCLIYCVTIEAIDRKIKWLATNRSIRGKRLKVNANGETENKSEKECA